MVVPANGLPTSAPQHALASLHHRNLSGPHREMGLVQIRADQPKRSHTTQCGAAQPNGEPPTARTFEAA